VDRLLLVGAVVLLLRTNVIPPITLFIFAKDIATLPALGIQLTHRERIADLGKAGKMLTLLQGVALLWLATTQQLIVPISFLLGVAGAIIGGFYLYRVVYRK
jgi:hypothetical protein